MKHALPILLLVLIVAGIYLLITNVLEDTITLDGERRVTVNESDVAMDTTVPEQATTTAQTPQVPTPPVLPSETVLGQSVEGRDIVAYHVGQGANEVLVVGGIHGGYSPNTTEVVNDLYAQYEAMGAPEGMRLTFIPLLNPDGVAMGSGAAGRFNANNVDVNRNFDCEWSEEGMWRSQTVSGGEAPFSEPEAQAIRAYVAMHEIAAAIVYYSAAGEVFPAQCGNSPVLPATTAMLTAYADASGYTAKEEFDYYAVTGDMTNWLAKEGVPTISVLLTNHSDSEFQENLRGITAALGTLE
jgi:hypothetical protein